MSSAGSESPSVSQLKVRDVVSIIVGIIVGASIYRSPWLIYSNLPETIALGSRVVTVPAWALGLSLWAFVGALCLLGALCYAELGTAYPTSGGDYTYLTRAYGHGVGFSFAWAEMSIIRTGASISGMAYIFADYANKLYPLDRLPSSLSFLAAKPTLTYATLAITVIALVNLFGLRPGKIIQNILTSGKLLGLAAILITGFLYFLWPRQAVDVVPEPSPVWKEPSLALAVVFVFYAFGGWNEAAYVAGELKDRRRSLILALLIGIGLVTIIYIAINGAYLLALGPGRIRASKVVAAEVMRLSMGDAGAKMISGLIMLSALGAIHGLIYTGIRLYSNFGEHERLFSVLSAKGRLSVPPAAVAVQALFSIAIIALFEFGGDWKPWVARQCETIGLGLPENFTKPATDGFDDLVACTAPVFWLFFLMTGFSVIVLRSREPETPRPFRVPLYPIVPLLFCASCAFMLYRSTTYAFTRGPAELMTVVAFVLLGVPLYGLSGPPRQRRSIFQPQ